MTAKELEALKGLVTQWDATATETKNEGIAIGLSAAATELTRLFTTFTVEEPAVRIEDFTVAMGEGELWLTEVEAAIFGPFCGVTGTLTFTPETPAKADPDNPSWPDGMAEHYSEQRAEGKTP